MESTARACSLLLLTMVAVSSGRNATHYFEKARFKYSPSRPEDAIVFLTAIAPPLICELEMDGDWIGGDRLKADLILSIPNAISHYTCSFEGNATTSTNLNLIQTGLPDVFVSTGENKIQFIDSKLACTTESQLPDEFFHLRIHRPNEDRSVKCRIEGQEERLYVRFPGYPSVICQKLPPLASSFHFSYRFKLPGIVGDRLECVFQVYWDLQTSNKRTEQRLHQSLVSSLPTREDGELSDVVCSRRASPNAAADFHVRLPGAVTYDCNFSGT